MNIYHENYYADKEDFDWNYWGDPKVGQELIMYNVRDRSIFQHFYLPWQQGALEMVLEQMLLEEDE